MRSNYNHHKAMPVLAVLFDSNFGPSPLRSTPGHATTQRQQQAFLGTTRIQSLSVKDCTRMAIYFKCDLSAHSAREHGHCACSAGLSLIAGIAAKLLLSFAEEI